MRYSSCFLLSTVSICLAFPANAQDARDPIDEVTTIGEDEEEAIEPRDTAGATQIEPGTEAEQALGQGVYPVGPITIEGLGALSVTDFVDIIERYAARELTGEQLNTLASEVAARAQDKGYVFATATIEPQSLRAGVLRLRVDEGRIDRIRIDGDDDTAIRGQLAPLMDGRPVTKARLERQLLLADDISGVRVRRAYFERDGDVGVLVLERMDHAQARGARIYAELRGYSATCDAYHITSPDIEAIALTECMNLALADAGVGTTEIDYLNAHGTSTQYNDRSETQAIKNVFGDHARDALLVSSTKSMTGHLLGAAGERLSLSRRQFFGTLRVAATGRDVSPPLFETMEVLGKDRTISRVKSAMERLSAV